MSTEKTNPDPCFIQFDPDDGYYIDITLEQVPSYGEWIPNEGGDICLYRARDDRRVVGAHLPMYSKSVVVFCGGGMVEVKPPPKLTKSLVRKALDDIFSEATNERNEP